MVLDIVIVFCYYYYVGYIESEKNQSFSFGFFQDLIVQCLTRSLRKDATQKEFRETRLTKERQIRYKDHVNYVTSNNDVESVTKTTSIVQEPLQMSRGKSRSVRETNHRFQT